MDTRQSDEAMIETKFSSWLESALSTNNPKSTNDELSIEARQAFRSLRATTAGDSRESSLAKLLKSLGPGLTANLPSRVCSLHIILGAIDGLQNSELSIGTANLLVAFFLEQVAPTEEESDNFGEDYSEQVRDLSLRCLSNTMKCYLGAAGSLVEMVEAVKLLCTTARQAVERRCAVPAEDDDYQGFGLSGMGAVTGGLSTLPRSRRSLCFDLLQSAVVGVDHTVTRTNESQVAKLSSKIATELTSFVSFACSCLQGESDPRCLMQFLVLFRKIQVAFEPIFRAGKLSSFPITEMFDAVAPYYPVNFTPPPHDNHSITRTGLKNALMSVLCGFGYDELAGNKNQDTMQTMSLGIVLERLIPLDGDDGNLAQSANEKREALDDLRLLLFPDDCPTLDCLAKGSVTQLSKALVYTHQEAAIAVSRGGSDTDDDKLLADACRSLIADIASNFEGATDRALWDVFVKDSVSGMASKLDSNSMESRIAVTYLASLAAGGGPHTLRFVLGAGLENLITKLKDNLNDEESATMATYGIGAFFSSTYVAIEKARAKGLVLHPHPVEKFSSSAFEVLYSVFSESESAFSATLKTAALLALESLLSVSPSDCFDDPQIDQVCLLLTGLATDVAKGSPLGECSHSSPEFMMACAQSLGSLLGKSSALDRESSDGESASHEGIMASKKVQDVLSGRVMVDLLCRATQTPKKGDLPRYDRIALARACSSNAIASGFILEALLRALKESLELHSLDQPSIECATALSFVLKNAGKVAAQAFHELVAPGVTVHDVLDKLCALDPRAASAKTREQGKEMTSLNLPATVEELEIAQRKTQKIVSLLLPAYQKCVPQEEVLKLLCLVSKILPPLSDSDVARLSITLPLLSAALENGTLPSPDDPVFHSAADQFASMSCDLASYSLSAGYEARSRTGAATCLNVFIVHFARRETSCCPAKQVLEDVAIPSLWLAYDELVHFSKGKPAKDATVLEKFVDCLNLCSDIGSAAACRGGNSAATADALASFFVDLACKSKAVVPFTKDSKRENGQIDLLDCDSSTSYTSVCAALSSVAAFGSMLRLQDKRTLWKQRLTHNTLNSLEPAMKGFHENTMNSAGETLGLVAIICHLICGSNLKSISLSKKGEMVRIVVNSLTSGPFYGIKNAPGVEQQLGEVKRLAIAALLRLSSSSTGLLSSYSESIIIGLLRAYASTPDADVLSDIVCKLLILQVMERLCHMEVRKKVLVTMKPAVVSILGAAMNHPSRLLREAAVTVRNTWSTLE